MIQVGQVWEFTKDYGDFLRGDRVKVSVAPSPMSQRIEMEVQSMSAAYRYFITPDDYLFRDGTLALVSGTSVKSGYGANISVPVPTVQVGQVWTANKPGIDNAGIFAGEFLEIRTVDSKFIVAVGKNGISWSFFPERFIDGSFTFYAAKKSVPVEAPTPIIVTRTEIDLDWEDYETWAPDFYSKVAKGEA